MQRFYSFFLLYAHYFMLLQCTMLTCVLLSAQVVTRCYSEPLWAGSLSVLIIEVVRARIQIIRDHRTITWSKLLQNQYTQPRAEQSNMWPMDGQLCTFVCKYTYARLLPIRFLLFFSCVTFSSRMPPRKVSALVWEPVRSITSRRACSLFEKTERANLSSLVSSPTEGCWTAFPPNHCPGADKHGKGEKMRENVTPSKLDWITRITCNFKD